MESSATKTLESDGHEIHGDAVSIGRWFAGYAAFVASACTVLAVLVAREPWSWSAWTDDLPGTFALTSPAIKLLVFAVYLSLCCTFLPMPTAWIVAGVATREAAVAAGASQNVFVVAALTTLLVAVVGAAGSTLANLNDYHLFTLLLRSRRVASVRATRTYRAAAKWFARGPFFILVLFNVIPIPVDVIRMLATTYRYPRLPFAAANFVGRFVRYAAIAFVTYWWNLGWLAVVVLLALAAAMASARGAKWLYVKCSARRTP